MTLATTGWPARLLTLDDWDSLDPDETHRVECSEGVLFVTPKPLPLHQRAAARLAVQLDDQLPADLTALADVEVLLGAAPLTVRAPDVLITTEAAVSLNRPRLDVGDVQMVVEIISEGSRRTDTVTKLSEYGEAGIPDYLIIDLGGEILLRWFQLAPGSTLYGSPKEFRGGVAQLGLGADPLRIDLEALTRR